MSSKSSTRKCKRRRKPFSSSNGCDELGSTIEESARETLNLKRHRIERQDSVEDVRTHTKTVVDFPYPTDEDDHCESPLEAYQDITPFLKHLERLSTSNHISIYDPYYCNGAVKRHLNQLGFGQVYNEKEDCYEAWKSLRSFGDVLVTNPPYSGDHIQRLLEYATSSRRQGQPFFLLLPNWVVKKDYYQTSTRHIRPFYLVPHKRYVYAPPKDFRSAKKSDTHKKSAPFVSMWYCWAGNSDWNEQLIRRFYQEKSQDLDLARSKSALRDLRRKKR